MQSDKMQQVGFTILALAVKYETRFRKAINAEGKV